MKPLAAAVVLAGCVLVAAPARADTSAPSPGGLRWRTDVAAAEREAAKTNRPLLVFFSAEWCIPCKEMLRSLADREVAALVTRRFVPLFVDVTEDTPAAAALRDRYRVNALPDLLRLEQLVDAAALRAALERSLR
ncbi:MAG TPA: thioredoxin family protein [Polyangia bacterium]|nr:thioredoxin family protein [Polyangia bacterium]